MCLGKGEVRVSHFLRNKACLGLSHLRNTGATVAQMLQNDTIETGMTV